MRINRLTAAIGTLAAVAALTACSEQAAEVVDPGTGSVVEESAPATDTHPVGTTVEVGDWNVTVTKVVKNADAAINKAWSYNDKPKGQYVLVTYKATYVGDEREANVWDLSWSFTDAAQVTHSPASALTPAEDSPTEARKGGSVTQDEVFDVPTEQIAGGLITVESYTDGLDKVYADFTF